MASKRVSEKKVVVSTSAASSSAVRKPTASRRTPRSAKSVETPAVSPVEFEAATPVAVALVVDQPTQESIAALAYSYWLARNCEGGSPEEDWLRAEQELRACV
jgi:hypothetical protein